MRQRAMLGGVMFCAAAALLAQSAGTFQFSVIAPPSIGEPLPCPPPTVCEVYSRVNVVRVGGTAGPVSVDVSVAGGTATLGADYELGGGVPLGATATRLFFPDGSATNSMLVVPKQDFIPEPSETVILQITNPLGGATIGSPNIATVTILDTSAQLQTVPVLSPASYALLAGVLAVAGTLLLLRGR